MSYKISFRDISDQLGENFFQDDGEMQFIKVNTIDDLDLNIADEVLATITTDIEDEG
jgi:hypothetical protein